MGSVNLLRELPSNQPNDAVLEAFKDIGQILADARKEQNLSIKHVASKIHIRQRYLVDLEEGELYDLPGRVYIFGFIRTYARFLNLDGEELIRRISIWPELSNADISHAPLPPPSEDEPSYLILVISSIIILALTIGGYFFLKPSSNEIHPLAGVTPTDNSQSQTPINVESPEPKVPEISHESKNEALNQIKETPKAPSVSSESKIIYPKDMPTVGTLMQSTSKEDNAQDPSAGLAKQIKLKASEPSWVEVRDETNRIIFMRVMKRGEEYVVPDKPGITISTGNAGGMTILVGNNPLPSLGNRGEVKRGIRVETLKQ